MTKISKTGEQSAMCFNVCPIKLNKTYCSGKSTNVSVYRYTCKWAKISTFRQTVSHVNKPKFHYADFAPTLRHVEMVCVRDFHDLCLRFFPRGSFGESRRNRIWAI